MPRLGRGIHVLGLAVGAAADGPAGPGHDDVKCIDQGGALLFRARAGRKSAGNLGKITEWDGFADPSVNRHYARVFSAANVAGADDLGRKALKQIADIRELGKRTRNFADLVPKVRGISAADRVSSTCSAPAPARSKPRSPPASERPSATPRGPERACRPTRPPSSRRCDTLNAALAKQPDHVGIVKRGTTLPSDELAKHQVGKVVTKDGFTSTGIERGSEARSRRRRRRRCG